MLYNEFFILAIIFTFIDSIYLYSISKFFNSIVSSIQGKPLQLEIISTFFCYISLLLGLYYFIILQRRSYFDAALLGMFVYSAFEFTNKAIFKKWKWSAVIIDTLWGGILFGLSTYLVYKIYGIK